MSDKIQNVATVRRHVSLEAAEAVVAAARAKAAEIGVPAAIAVVDADGTLKNFVRMDGAPLLPVRIAQQKAWTAISFGMPTHAWWDMVKDDPPLLHGIVHQEDVVIFGGGYPITDGDDVIGGVGVSGGHYTQDQEIAEAGLAAL
jgi:uncharacterized protein GlcG (DUF336 family)